MRSLIIKFMVFYIVVSSAYSFGSLVNQHIPRENIFVRHDKELFFYSLKEDGTFCNSNAFYLWKINPKGTIIEDLGASCPFVLHTNSQKIPIDCTQKQISHLSQIKSMIDNIIMIDNKGDSFFIEKIVRNAPYIPSSTIYFQGKQLLVDGTYNGQNKESQHNNAISNRLTVDFCGDYYVVIKGSTCHVPDRRVLIEFTLQQIKTIGDVWSNADCEDQDQLVVIDTKKNIYSIERGMPSPCLYIDCDDIAIVKNGLTNQLSSDGSFNAVNFGSSSLSQKRSVALKKISSSHSFDQYSLGRLVIDKDNQYFYWERGVSKSQSFEANMCTHRIISMKNLTDQQKECLKNLKPSPSNPIHCYMVDGIEQVERCEITAINKEKVVVKYNDNGYPALLRNFMKTRYPNSGVPKSVSSSSNNSLLKKILGNKYFLCGGSVCIVALVMYLYKDTIMRCARKCDGFMMDYLSKC